MATFIKDPDSLLDYVVDWETWLNGDYIVSADTSAQTGVSVASETNTSVKHTIWVSGGTVGNEYQVTSRIWTNVGRKDDRTFTLIVQEK